MKFKKKLTSFSRNSVPVALDQLQILLHGRFLVKLPSTGDTVPVDTVDTVFWRDILLLNFLNVILQSCEQQAKRYSAPVNRGESRKYHFFVTGRPHPPFHSFLPPLHTVRIFSFALLYRIIQVNLHPLLIIFSVGTVFHLTISPHSNTLIIKQMTRMQIQSLIRGAT